MPVTVFVKLDEFVIRDTRSAINDTDYAAFQIQYGAQTWPATPAVAFASVGDVDNGTHKFDQTIFRLGPIAVDETKPDVFCVSFGIRNSGQEGHVHALSNLTSIITNMCPPIHSAAVKEIAKYGGLGGRPLDDPDLGSNLTMWSTIIDKIKNDITPYKLGCDGNVVYDTIPLTGLEALQLMRGGYAGGPRGNTYGTSVYNNGDPRGKRYKGNALEDGAPFACNHSQSDYTVFWNFEEVASA
jgi:hypothetical protein